MGVGSPNLSYQALSTCLASRVTGLIHDVSWIEMTEGNVAPMWTSELKAHAGTSIPLGLPCLGQSTLSNVES